MAHCWVLKQQDHAGWLFFVGVAGVGRLFLVSLLHRSRTHVCGVCGVGLLFENYIVDASILYKKQFPRYMNLDLVRVLWPFLGVVVRGAVFVVLSKMFFDLCGQVFKSTRWMPWH